MYVQRPLKVCRRSFAFLTVLTATLLLAAAPAFSAQSTRGIGLVSVRTAQGKQVNLYKGSYALLIGVSDYTAGWPDLESIPGELAKLRVALEAKGFRVVTVMNPDSRRLEDSFKGFIDTYGYDRENRLLFYFSGHGYTRTVGEREKGYLVPADAPNPNRDDKGFARKSLSMSQINTWAREIEAKHALFLFDSCFSGAIFRTRALPVPRHITDKTARPVRQFITAGSAGEEVPARSVFLPSFIRAIEGEGDVNRDGYVTGTELGQFLHEKVLEYDSGQTPQYGKIRDPALDEGDFVFRAPRPVAVQPPAPVQTPQAALLLPPVPSLPAALATTSGGVSVGLLSGGILLGLGAIQQFAEANDLHSQAQDTTQTDPQKSAKLEEDRDQAATNAAILGLVGLGLTIWAFADSDDDRTASRGDWQIRPIFADRSGQLRPAVMVRYGW